MNVLAKETAISDASRPTPRIHSLDLARGIAILGTLAMNIWLFTHVAGLTGFIANPVTPDTPGAAAIMQQVLTALTSGKSLGLLTLMFGIGLEIQRRSMVKSGLRWPGSYLWRAALLLVDGLLNFVLIAEFDVLMGYAITGGVVAYLMLTSQHAQRVWIWVLGLGHVLVVTALSGLIVLAEGMATSAPEDPPTTNPYADGSFIDLALFRLDNMVMFRVEAVAIFGMSVAMFLLGAHLFRAGIFAPEGVALRKRLMILGLGCVAPLDLAIGAFGGSGGMVFDRYVLAPVVALGLLALIAHIGLHTSPTAWFSLRLQEVGKTALSGYIGQNLVASFLFYGWGLGLAAHLGSWRVPATVVAFVGICAVNIAFAHFWLRRFDQGPIEWLWKKSYLALSGAPRK